MTAQICGMPFPASDSSVETIRLGDLVETLDDGLPPVRWVGSKTMNLQKLSLGTAMAPYCIAAGALGENLPSRDLLLSPQHRALIRSRIAQRMFGADEVLIAVKALTEIDGIEQLQDQREITYVHFMFDKHQIVFAEGAEVESLYPGKEALASVGRPARQELFKIFPELEDLVEAPLRARAFVSGKKARRFSARQNAKLKPLSDAKRQHRGARSEKTVTPNT